MFKNVTNIIFSIDTPGVIDRVSTLFRGHPNLIQGFNTFLPPGYRIECSSDPSDPNPVRVTTPTGTTTRPNTNFGQPWERNDYSGHEHDMHTGQQIGTGGYIPEQVDPLQGGGGQIEFNHAISYVNKIKTRFANQPDIYKQFLEILQTYQREQKPIGEIYDQVTELFSGSPDLLNDFKHFLPDTNNAIQQQQSQVSDGDLFYPPPNGVTQLPPVGNFHPHSGPASAIGPSGPHNQYGGYGFEQDSQGVGYQKAEYERKESDSYSDQGGFAGTGGPEIGYSNIRSGPGTAVSKTPKGAQGTKGGTGISNPTLVPGIPEPVPPSENVKSSSLLEELNFFDKVKKAIGNKQTYIEFLKILNLYSQDILDRDTLVERVESFLGENHPDLVNWFKNFVGYEEKTKSIESITFKKHQLELSLCKAYGPSYRQLPKWETYMPCSGRDEMCWEVLNDEWVGHPTWASEDSGFIAHRKNQYEEILFKIEEERHEFDYFMESNLRTIQTLETIANRIANMTPEQKAVFKLPPGLDHSSTTIYQKVIRKIYDKDRGLEVIEALHENPAVAVPVVLKRLKQKDEEWKRAHREWNKVWREMEQKVFYKSLDHLGLTFKQADKKLLTTRQLVSEISTVKMEQQNKRLHPLMPKPQEQLNYNFKDYNLFIVILRLALVFINHTSSYSSNDREKLSEFFKLFLTRFFGILVEELETSLEQWESVLNKNKDEDSQKQNGTVELKESKEKPSRSQKRHRESDLLKDVLKRRNKVRKDENVESPSQQSSESEENSEVENFNALSELWINASSPQGNAGDATATAEVPKEKRDKYNMFCNTVIYVFFRHLTTLYQRLEELKNLNDEVSQEIRSRRVPQFAKDLNLVSHQLEDMNIAISGDSDCFVQVMQLSERLIEGNLEHQWFEETLRQGYRNRAYKLYTIDKVVHGLVKHMHTIVADSKTSEMLILFEADREKPTTTAKEQILYHIQVRSLMGADENMFKITFKEKEHSVNIQFVSLDDLTINDHENAEEKYNYYVTSYIMSHPTEGVPASKIRIPFFEPFIEDVDESLCEGTVNTGLKASICENTYRLFFETDSHDEFTSNLVFRAQPANEEVLNEKEKRLGSFLEDKEIGWKKLLKNNHAEELCQKRLEVLFEKGAKAYRDYVEVTETVIEKESDGVLDESRSDDELGQGPSGAGDDREDEDANARNDSTLQGHNDTTQPEGNDSTADDMTLHQE